MVKQDEEYFIEKRTRNRIAIVELQKLEVRINPYLFAFYFSKKVVNASCYGLHLYMFLNKQNLFYVFIMICIIFQININIYFFILG